MIVYRFLFFLTSFIYIFFLLPAFSLANGISYNINASFDPSAHTISGKARITSAESFISIYLYPNIYAAKDTAISTKEYDRIYPRNFNLGYIEILGVTDSKGNNIPFRITGEKNTLLKIEDSSSEIVIDFKTKIPEK